MTFNAISQRTPWRCAACLIFLALLLLAVLGSLRFGELRLTATGIAAALFRPDGSLEAQIIWHIRLPRILLGGLVGASFAVAGVILQGVLCNPLAAPGIIGVSAGGGLSGILIMLVFPQYGGLLVPAAFGGALTAALLVYLLSWKRGASPVRLILAGVAVSAMLGAFSSAVLLFNAEKAGGILEFSIGSLSTRSWTHVRQVWPYMAVGFAAAVLQSGRLNILAIGDEAAIGLGLRVERVRFTLLATAALLAAAAVSAVGLLGFVGLIAPHIVRLLIGSDNRFLIPAAALCGAVLVVTCDTLGRVVMSPSELPVGIIMAMAGPPFFLWLLRHVAYES